MDDRTQTKTNLQDLRTHLQKLEEQKLLRRVTIPINKDTELMPLVRWQFRGLKEEQRTGFLFENVTYARGLGCEVSGIKDRWQKAQAKPTPPKLVEHGSVQEEVHMGESLLEHGGIEEFPIPISTPGFDISPYTTATNWLPKATESPYTTVCQSRGQMQSANRVR